ncbi:MAG TPA: SRPBCC family protein [Anaeromyxobacteraceae bacterium]|nr:SRPBCC family protein [Anaeromyxobacteraceae bacterium]
MARTVRGAGVVAAAAALGVYAFPVRRWMRNWGATAEEQAARMPGDDLILEPVDVSTRAISIHASPAEVWPLVADLRGLRSFRASEILGALGWMVVGKAADDDVGEHRALREGDAVPAGASELRVIEAQPERLLLLRHDGLGYTYSWATLLTPDGRGGTRLITRARYRGSRLLLATVDPLVFGMVRRWLLELKVHAEARHARPAAAAHPA